MNDFKAIHVSLSIRFYLPPAFMLVSFLASSSNLKMDATGSSETSVDFQRTTLRFPPGDRTPYNIVHYAMFV
jgi:hypothetical protein